MTKTKKLPSYNGLFLTHFIIHPTQASLNRNYSYLYFTSLSPTPFRGAFHSSKLFHVVLMTNSCRILTSYRLPYTLPYNTFER